MRGTLHAAGPSGDLPTDLRHKVVEVEQQIELGLLTPPQNLGP